MVQAGVYDAFREADCRLEVFDYFAHYNGRNSTGQVRHNLINLAGSFRPDLVHMQIQHTSIIDADTIRKIRQKVPKVVISNWTGDVRNYVPRQFKEMAYVSDYNLISSTGQLEFFKKEIPGKDIRYWQIGFNPLLYHPQTTKKDFRYDVTFVGNVNTREGYPGHNDRMMMAHSLRKAFGTRFGLFGNGWPSELKSKGSFDQKKLRDLYHQSYSLISVSHYNDLSHYFSDRLLMCMACGRPTVSLKFPKWESYFTDNCDLMIAETPQDIVSKVKQLTANPDLADYIGASGATKVFAEHTYLSRVNELLEITKLR